MDHAGTPEARGGAGAAATAPTNWVQCDACAKWRKLPPHAKGTELPDSWTCALNTWAPALASCDAAQEADGDAGAAFAPAPASAPASAPAARTPATGLDALRGELVGLVCALNDTSAALKRYRDDAEKADTELFEALNGVVARLSGVDHAAKTHAGGELQAAVPRGLLLRLDRVDGDNDPSLFTADVLRRAEEENKAWERAKATLRAAAAAAQQDQQPLPAS